MVVASLLGRVNDDVRVLDLLDFNVKEGQTKLFQTVPLSTEIQIQLDHA